MVDPPRRRWRLYNRPDVRRTLIILTVVALAVGGSTYALFRPPPGPRSMKQFDAARTADLELRMWQAYYGKERVRLFALLVTMLHEQYHFSWAAATSNAFYLARAAARFAELRSNYDVVLPDLETAYTSTRDWLHAGFDPAAVSRAELAWWVARRTPGRSAPEEVGTLIADEYALLYEMPRELFVSAAELRAEAAALRDSAAAAPDWETIRQLLLRSYAELRQALSTGAA